MMQSPVRVFEACLESVCDRRDVVERLFAAQRGEDGVEVFEAGVLDDDAAFALLVFDVDLEAEGALEAVLGFADVGVFGLRRLWLLSLVWSSGLMRPWT